MATLVKSRTARRVHPNITIANSVTLSTRVRCAILKAFAKTWFYKIYLEQMISLFDSWTLLHE